MRVRCSFVMDSYILFFTTGKWYFLEEGGIEDDLGVVWKIEDDQKTLRMCRGDIGSMVVATFEGGVENGD